MRTYARIADGVVAELVATSEPVAELFHPSLDFVDATGSEAGVGWLWTGSAFMPPLPPQPTLRPPSLGELEAALAALAAQVAALRGQG